MGHANYVEMLTCVLDRPQPYPHPLTGLVTAALHVRVGPKGQSIRLEVPPTGDDDAMARAALNLKPGSYLHVRGWLGTRTFTHAFWEELPRYCPFCGEPYGDSEREVDQSREIVRCRACGQTLTTARRRVHTFVVATELADLAGPPRRRLPRGPAYSANVFLLGVLAGRVITALHRNTGLVESRFPLVVYRPGGPEAGKDYPWVYVLPQDGRDGLARSVRALQPGDPVFVHGQIRARRILDRNQLHDVPVSFCPSCRHDLGSTPVERNAYQERVVCPRCHGVVPMTYRTAVLDVVATGVEFLKRVQEFTYAPLAEAAT